MSEESGGVAAGAGEFAASLAAFVKDNRLYGAAASVVHGDELAWAGGAGFADLASRRAAGPGTLYRIASITKTFTGTAILRLRDAGKLDLDDPAVTWLPELAAAGPGIGHVTIRRLLSHESGLSSEPPGTDWASLEPAYEGLARTNLARSAEIKTAIGPSLQPKYSNLGYQLLGEIVKRASGTDYPDYVRREILDPLGLADTVFGPLGDAHRDRAATGYGGRSFSDELEAAPEMTGIWAEGGLWSTASDLAKWVSFQLRAHAGRPADSPVLGAATLREMHKPRYLSDETWTRAWGISWYAVRKDDVTWIQHSGGLHGFTTNACFDREQKVGAVVLLNGIGDAPALAMELGAVARRLAQAAAPPLAPPAPMPELYKPLLGLYAFPRMDGVMRVEWRDGELVLLSPDMPDQIMPLRPDGGDADTFIVGPGFRDSGEVVRFARRPDGQVASAFVGSATILRLEAV